MYAFRAHHVKLGTFKKFVADISILRWAKITDDVSAERLETLPDHSNPLAHPKKFKPLVTTSAPVTNTNKSIAKIELINFIKMNVSITSGPISRSALFAVAVTNDEMTIRYSGSSPLPDLDKTALKQSLHSLLVKDSIIETNVEEQPRKYSYELRFRYSDLIFTNPLATRRSNPQNLLEKTAINHIVAITSPGYIEEPLAVNAKATHTETINHHFKIWFSRPKDPHPLGGVSNELRLIRHQQLFAQEDCQLSIISNFEDFPKAKQERLLTFCKQHKIKLVSIQDIFYEIMLIDDLDDRKIHLQLFHIVMLEIYSPYGNLAAASDIVRILRPAMKLGTYSDLDFAITKGIRDKINKSKDLLLNIWFRQSIMSRNTPCHLTNMQHVENHFIKFSSNSDALFVNYRKKIVERYSNLDALINYLLSSSHRGTNNRLVRISKLIHRKKEQAETHSSTTFCYEQLFYLRCYLKEALLHHQYQDFMLLSVIYASGPDCITSAFYRYISNPKVPLDKLSLSSSRFMVNNDLSWLTSGRQKMANIETQMEASAKTIQRAVRTKLLCK